MPSNADVLYPNGPKKELGNEDPWKILSTYPGNHTGALINGERKHQEAFVQLYGYEEALSQINDALKTLGKGKDSTGYDTTPWHDEMTKYRDELLARQGS